MNRLADETSPYLRQHADNPVDWHPWDDVALQRARSEDRPILLSIGYSSCHWCHVMAHESFEDEDIAAVMNERYVNIKVDREERPDIDKIYQLAHYLLNRQGGGWPLTVFVDPHSHLPFFSGTYFPKTARHGLPGFKDLLMRIGEAYATEREGIDKQNSQLVEVLGSLKEVSPAQGVAMDALLTAARKSFAEQYDPRHGGFGRAPKFPMPSSLEWLMFHQAGLAGNEAADAKRQVLDMVMTTLTKMARGGIYDHVGGGFCRYATDQEWMIPHFEKMLYDNGALLSLYADALGIAPDALFAGAVRETATFIEREMQHPEGGYYASFDADSEGEEGRFYVWRKNEVKRLLEEDEYLVVETLYGLDKPANFEGKWNLYRTDSWRAVAGRLYLEPEAADAALESAKAKLFETRARRVPPGRDDKILTAWNGIAIRGMVKAGLRLKNPAWIDSAARAATFLRENLVVDGRLHATWMEGRAKHHAYLDDTTNLLGALITLLSARWDDDDMAFAIALGDALLEQFFDAEEGGFFFTAHDHETLIHRPKPTTEDALPPGNGTAARALIDLSHLTGDARYLEAAQQTLDWAKGTVEQYPAGHATLLTALEMLHAPGEHIMIRGPAADLAPWLEAAHGAAHEEYHPNRMSFAIPYEATQVPAYLPRLVSAETRERVTAYRCEQFTCGAPIENLDEFKALLAAPSRQHREL